jgi:hypothetical protein
MISELLVIQIGIHVDIVISLHCESIGTDPCRYVVQHVGIMYSSWKISTRLNLDLMHTAQMLSLRMINQAECVITEYDPPPANK